MQLMDQAEQYPGVELFFNMRCETVDLESATVTFTNTINGEEVVVNGAFVIGGDGANSAVRRSMISTLDNFDQQVDWLDHGYKELTIPAGDNQSFRIEKNALHI